MGDMKRTLRINMWKLVIVFGLIGWSVIMYLDPVRLNPESLLTMKWYAIGMLVIVFGFIGSIFMWTAKIRSAKTVGCHGSDTWDPSEWHEIPAEVMGDKIVFPRLLIRGVGGFKAMGIYVGGRGAKGWDVVVDFPGIWYRLGSNLVLNTDTRETYVGQHEHRNISIILDRMNTYFLGIPGMISIADDTPINVYAIPRRYPGIPEGEIERYTDLRGANAYWSKIMDNLKTENFDLRMMLSRSRATTHGESAFRQAMRPKGGENTGQEQQSDPQQ